MVYTPTTWVNDGAPAINEDNLNKMETGIDEAHDHIADTADPHSVTKAQVGLTDVPDLDTTDAVNNEHAHANSVELAKVTDGDHDVSAHAPTNADNTAANETSHATVLVDGDIGVTVLAEQTIGIADDNLVEIDHAAVADNDYAKFTANGLEGREYSEVKTDLSLNNVENTAHSTDAHTMAIDGRDVSADGSKLDGVAAGADVTGSNTCDTPGGASDYSDITANDGATDVTAAELEELTDGSATTLHSHAGGGGVNVLKAKGTATGSMDDTEIDLAWASPQINTTDITVSGADITIVSTGVYVFDVQLNSTNANRTELQIRTYIDVGAGYVQDTDELLHNYVSRDGDQNIGGLTLSTALDLDAGDKIKFAGFGDTDGTCVARTDGTILRILQV